MKITSIIKRDENNIVIHLDNDEKLYLSLEVFMKNGLRRGDELSDDSFALFVRENRKYFVRQSAIKYLTNRLHSSNELRIKLLKKKYDSDIVAEVIEELKAKGFLNDREFALCYATENIKNKLWGRNKVKAGLIQKSIKGDIIESVLQELFNEEDETDNAVQLANKKLRILEKRGYDSVKTKQKLISFLLSRGYSYDLIKRILSNLNIETEF